MGRHAGWITAATGLAQTKAGTAPHLLLFPEIRFDEEAFLAAVKRNVDQYGYCAVGVSEGLQDKDGKFLAESGLKDAFGHAQLGGVAPRIAELVRGKLGFKHHWAVADYLQRSARHIASKTDLEQSYAVGKAAVEFAVKGLIGVMPTIVRASSRALPLEDRRGAAHRRRQRREEDAARLHHARRLPHHRRSAATTSPR